MFFNISIISNTYNFESRCFIVPYKFKNSGTIKYSVRAHARQKPTAKQTPKEYF